MTVTQDLQTLATDELNERVAGLVGQPFSGARMGYGDELRLAFGSGLTGSWTLGTRTARWILLGDLAVVGRDSDAPNVLRGFTALSGATITAVDATRDDRTLTLGFDGGQRFVLLPNKPHRTRDDVDLWELFSPYGWWLAVRRDGSIDLVPDDLTLAERKQRRDAA